MSTKNGKKSRNRSTRHDEPAPTSFKPPPSTHTSLDDIPLPSKPLKKIITLDQPTDTIIPLQQDNNGSPNASNGNNRNRTRPDTPQSSKKMSALNNGSGKITAQEEVGVFIANGNGDGDQVIDSIFSSTDSTTDVYMEPLILDNNEPEPELLSLCDGESDSPDLPQLEIDPSLAANKNSPRCATRRSQTRYVPTPETPHSFLEGPLTISGDETPAEDISTPQEVQPLSPDVEAPSTPTITVTPSTPPIQQQFETSSTHSTDNLSSDSATDNCSTHAVVGSDITRMMNIDDQQMAPNDGDSLQLDEEQENVYEEIEAKDEAQLDTGNSRYEFDLGGEERPRSREGSIARTLTGRKSIRPGTDYRKYLLERGMSGGAEGSYTSTLGRSSSSGLKRKTTPTDFSTSTPNTGLKRRKLDTSLTTINWFSFISQPFYNLKNRFIRSATNITANADSPQSKTTPKLTGYKSTFGEDTVDREQPEEEEVVEVTVVNKGDEVEDVEVEDDVSLGVEALPGYVQEDKLIGEGKEIPVVVEVEERTTASNRKSCAIM